MLRRQLLDGARAAGLQGHVIFTTSGTTGEPKFACLSKDALLASARAVNEHLNVSESDVWLCPLPLFHVGGFAIFARGYLKGRVAPIVQGRWEPHTLVQALNVCKATLTSLVPTQVYDLVREECSLPDAVRAVIVGGGRLDSDVATRARQLGWPVLQSFGMTEAASQIATQSVRAPVDGEQGMRILSGWNVRVVEEVLEFSRGCPLQRLLGAPRRRVQI